ncbi:hypothetical protein DMUE_3758 [Dictyocoela muelleri]|nr:hypothetical protein DMUE_3758 [Dictyocoela muelleri]
MTKLYEKFLIDIKGPIKYSHFKTNNINKMFYILAIYEFIGRYAEIIVINDIHSNTICDAVLRKLLQVYDTPKYCVTDNRRQFNSSNFSKLLLQYNIKHINTSPHNPSGNSVIERIKKEIEIALRFSRGLSIKCCVSKIWRRINLTVNKTIGCSPFRIFFHNDPKIREKFRSIIDIKKI